MINISQAKLGLWQWTILPHPGRIHGPKSPGEIGLMKIWKKREPYLERDWKIWYGHSILSLVGR